MDAIELFSMLGFCLVLYLASEILKIAAEYFADLPIFSVPITFLVILLKICALPVAIIFHFVEWIHLENIKKSIHAEEKENYDQLLAIYRREFENKTKNYKELSSRIIEHSSTNIDHIFHELNRILLEILPSEQKSPSIPYVYFFTLFLYCNPIIMGNAFIHNSLCSHLPQIQNTDDCNDSYSLYIEFREHLCVAFGDCISLSSRSMAIQSTYRMAFPNRHLPKEFTNDVMEKMIDFNNFISRETGGCYIPIQKFDI